jgi:FkbH-like protein
MVSKNDHVNSAIMPFREHPHMDLTEDDISVFVTNWENKPDNIRTIQQILNIGFESIVFLDDNPFERNAVREFLPSVMVPELPEDPAHYVRALAELKLFETASFSEADRQRPGQYREESRRELSRVQHTNITDYLISLDMTIALERFNEFNLPRIAQFIQRSNQFNLATNRYSEAACEAFMNDPRYYAPFTLTLYDKFGDYGLICVVIPSSRQGRNRNRRMAHELPCVAARSGIVRHEQNLRTGHGTWSATGSGQIHQGREEFDGRRFLRPIRFRTDRRE